jgi:hypothetical protein
MRRRPVSVIELPGYRRRADELLSVDEQDAIVDLIAYEPTCGDLIPGTGGLRRSASGAAAATSGVARALSTISTTPTSLFLSWPFMPRTRRPI